ncbi:BID domain-containing T4SS effector [Bartonella sp. CB74]|uniref:BID domain-containing T4SS effector n=1 Tax=Bartonella sp. CB74 TaxID=3113620 RepID=UPI002F964633
MKRHKSEALMDKNLENILIPRKEVPPLTREEIFEVVTTDLLVQSNKKEIQRLSKVVYGNPGILSQYVDKINVDPSSHKEVADQIASSPQSISKLAGIKRLGVKNSARRQAKGHVSQLSEAIEDYADAVSFVKMATLQKHETERMRCEQTVKMPSEQLLSVLTMSKEAQQEALISSIVLQKELTDFMSKVKDRLSPSDYKAINENDYAKIADSIGISLVQAEEVTGIIQKTKEAHQHVQKLKVHRSQAMAMAS